MADNRSAPSSSAQVFRVAEGARTQAPVCFRHHAAPAEAVCFDCLKAICRACLLQEMEGAVCVECAARKRNARKARNLGMGIAAVCLGAAAVGVVSTVELPYDYGAHTREVRQLQSRLEEDACDKRTILRLTELMLSAGNDDGALGRADAFFESCGQWERLRWVTYEAAKRAGDQDRAIADATLLIKDGPYDKDFRWWRGRAYELKGELESAARDYQQAIALQPALSNIPFNLATVLEKLDRPCEGIHPVEQFLHHHPDYEVDARVMGRLQELYARCPTLLATGNAAMVMRPDGTWRTPVLLDGKDAGLFTVDRQLAYVAVSRAVAETAGIKVPADAPRFILRSSWGALEGVRTSVALMQAQQAQARNVEIVVVEKMPRDVDALLGLSFLSRFHAYADGEVFVLEAKARDAIPAPQE